MGNILNFGVMIKFKTAKFFAQPRQKELVNKSHKFKLHYTSEKQYLKPIVRTYTSLLQFAYLFAKFTQPESDRLWPLSQAATCYTVPVQLFKSKYFRKGAWLAQCPRTQTSELAGLISKLYP